MMIIAIPRLSAGNEGPYIKVGSNVHRNMTFYKRRDASLFTRMKFQIDGFANYIVPANTSSIMGAVIEGPSWDRMEKNSKVPSLKRWSQANIITAMAQEDIRKMVFDDPLMRLAFTMWGVFDYDSDVL